MTFDLIGKCYSMRCTRRFFQSFSFAIIILLLFIWLNIQTPNMITPKPVTFQFLWQRKTNRNVSSYLKPKESTTLLEPNHLCGNALEYLFIVPSSLNNTHQRNIIRRTWGSWIKYAKGKINSKMKLFFILGLNSTEDRTISDHIVEEADKNQDIIVEDFIDSYLNLTLKSVFILKWTILKCPNIKYLVKVDDDTFINVPYLIKSMSALSLPKVFMVGTLICNAKPIHNKVSKWFSPKYMFLSNSYPNYLSGTAYIISGSLISNLYQTALITPVFHLEDIFLTGICAKKLGIKPINHPGFSMYRSTRDPCVSIDFISRHQESTEGIVKLWNLVHNASVIKKCQGSKKIKPKAKSKTNKALKWPLCKWI